MLPSSRFLLMLSSFVPITVISDLRIQEPDIAR